MSSVYQINKGVNKPVEFRGLKAQYIWWLGMGIAGLLLLFTGMYLCGVPVFVSLPLIAVLGIFWFRYVYRLSRRYGEHGMMKKMAARAIPNAIKINRTLRCKRYTI